MKSRTTIAATIVTLAVIAGPALAQEAQTPVVGGGGDWILNEIPENKATIAIAEFSSGLGLASRCVDGVFDMIIYGLPSAGDRESTREIALAVGENGDERTTVWQVGSDRTTAFSRLPARVARQLAVGGRLQVIVPGAPGARRTRYEMELDPSNAAVEKTLTACGRPLVDPRDIQAVGNGQNGLPSPIVWARVPSPQFPRLPGRSEEAYVGLSCKVVDGGRLEDCQVESEFPPRQLFAPAVLRSMGRARLKLTDEGVANGAKLDGGMITFVVNITMH